MKNPEMRKSLKSGEDEELNEKPNSCGYAKNLGMLANSEVNINNQQLE